MKLIICLIVLAFIANKILCQNLDIDLLRSINADHSRLMDQPVKFITNSVTPVLVGAPIIMFAVGHLTKDPDTDQRVVLFMSTLAASSIFSTSLKMGLRRTRPFIEYPDITKMSTAGSGSFPSGHTSSAFAGATALSLAYPKWYVIVPSMTWATMVGFSRMYLGVHYPSDVLAGAVIGSGSVLLSNYVNKKIFRKHISRRKFSPIYD